MVGKVEPLDTQYPAQKPDQITTYETTDLFSPTGGPGRRYNPDQLVGRRGLSIYRKMLQDEQVKAVCEFKSSAILARGYEFVFDKASSLSDEDKKLRIRLFTRVTEALRGSFDDSLEEISSGREFGFSMTEKVYGKVTLDGAQYVGINELAFRQPDRFEFTSDEYGARVGCWQRVGGKEISVDLDKMIHYVHRKKYDSIYGRSDLFEAYRSWYAKDQLIKLWVLYMEKFGGGIAVASQEGDTAPAPTSAAGQAVLEAIANLAANRAVYLPKGVVLDIKFPANTDNYEKSIIYFDLAIAKALLVPNLLGISHNNGAGSLAQSQTHLDAFFWTLAKDSKRLADTVNEQLFRDLGDQNFGDGEYPIFRFKDATLDHIKKLVDTFKVLSDAGAIVATEDDEKRFRDLLNMEPRDADSKPLVDPQAEAEKLYNDKLQQDAIKGAANATDKGSAEFARVVEMVQKIELKLAAMQSGDTVTNITAPITLNQPAPLAPVPKEQDGEHPDGEIVMHGTKFTSEEVFQKAARRVSFAVIERNVEDSIAAGVNRMADQMARGVYKALGTDAHLAELTDQDPSDIPSVQLSGSDVSKLRASSSELLAQGWKIGSAHAKSELNRARGEELEPSQELAKFARLEDKAAAYFDAKAFRMAGDSSDQAKKIIQTELQNAVKNGKPLALVRAAIWDALVMKGLTRREAVRGIETDDAVNAALNELWVDTEESAVAYLNTLVRTNVFESLNEARYQEFTDPALGDFVLAMQYAAVLDSSTTDICEHLNGRTYATDSDVWDEYRPPNHFNALAEGTMVSTMGGDKPIEQVQLGDLVLTHRGRYRRVYASMHKRPDRANALLLNCSTGRALLVTDEHPVLTSTGWRRADQLKAGDVLFENSEQLVRSGEIGLPDPHHFPSPFDEPLVAWDVVRSARGPLVPFAVDLKGDHGIGEREVDQVGALDMLRNEGNTAAIEQVEHQGFALCGIGSHSDGASQGGLVARLVGQHGVTLGHALRRIGASLTMGPMKLAGALRNYCRISVGYLGLLFLGSNRYAMAFAPTGQQRLADTEVAFNGAQRLAVPPMSNSNEVSADIAIGQVHKFSGWMPSTIISIVEAPATERVWNLGVEEDETYVAEGLIVHNCRSVLVPITAIDGWDGVESEPPSIEPAQGFD